MNPFCEPTVPVFRDMTDLPTRQSLNLGKNSVNKNSYTIVKIDGPRISDIVKPEIEVNSVEKLARTAPAAPGPNKCGADISHDIVR